MSRVNVEARRAYHREYRAKNRAKIKRHQIKWKTANLDKVKAAAREWAKQEYARDPLKSLARSRKYRYGVTAVEVDQMFLKQGGVCAICRTSRPSRGGKRTWHVDHCHTTRRFRGVLCARCNLMIGLGLDNPTILQRAATYLTQGTGSGILLVSNYS